MLCLTILTFKFNISAFSLESLQLQGNITVFYNFVAKLTSNVGTSKIREYFLNLNDCKAKK